MVILAHETLALSVCGAHIALLQNSAELRLRGQKLRRAQIGGPKIRWAKIEDKFVPQSFGPSICALRSLEKLGLPKLD